ncbi:MAG TPA: GntR family transcriptional regulator [Usitatibacter sp.]|nr:GntR family transcriptional regulator [Usitatibacter sp.]
MSAYDEIKKRIIELRYPPGEKLSEARLAEELRCGRSPVRTAFSRLQAEGFIAVSPQSGTYVRALTEGEIHDIFECRLLLETHATRLAAKNMSEEDLRKLRTAFRRLAPQGGDALGPDVFDDFNALDSMFHATVYRAAGNAIINDILMNLLEKAQWLKKSSPSTPERIRISFGELEAVLEALERRDPDAAEARMRDHIGMAEKIY